MSEALDIMMWPFLACLLLPGLLVYLGLHIVRRGIIFVDLALAQVAALGICMAILLGYDAHDWQTTAWSGVFTFAGAVVLTLTRPNGRARVPQEAWIGIVYVVAAAASFLMLSHSPEGNEELRRTMVGEILLVQFGELLRVAVLFLVIGGIHIAFRKPFMALSCAEGEAGGGSRKPWVLDFAFYILFGVVVTSFVKLAGVLLTFSYLIIPAVCATLLATSLRVRLVVGWGIASLASSLGLYASYRFDLPTGAAIVCSLGAVLVLTRVLAGRNS